MVAPLFAIVNPTAGGGRARRIWTVLERQLRAAVPGVEIRLTRAPGDAEALAREWAASERGSVLAVGGDGTFHEVANGLLAVPKPPSLIPLPAGSGNDFAENVGAGPALESLARRLRNGTLRSADVGRLTFPEAGGAVRTRYFLNSASVGVSALGSRYATRIGRAMPGKLRYRTAGVAALLRFGGFRATVRDGDRLLHDGPLLNVTVANTASFGGGLRISPASSPFDGKLDTVIVAASGFLRGLALLSRLSRGSHVAMEGVRTAPAEGAIRIEPSSPAPLEADGHEFPAAGAITVEVVPGALPLVL